MFQLEFHNKFSGIFPDINEGLFSRWIGLVIDNEGFVPGEINIILINDDEILELNKSTFNHDYFTDIITMDFVQGNLINGDLFISLDRIKENAKLNELEIKTEFARVLVHGVLHLFGYGDKTPKEKLIMTQKEDYYLSLRP